MPPISPIKFPVLFDEHAAQHTVANSNMPQSSLPTLDIPQLPTRENKQPSTKSAENTEILGLGKNKNAMVYIIFIFIIMFIYLFK